jgi:hypothetical protein
LERRGFRLEAVAIQLQGRVGEAAILFGHALRRARESGHLFSLAQALSVGQLLRCIRREPEGVLISATEVIRLAEENGFALWLHWGRFFRGWALAESGQFDEGLTEMVREIANIHRLGIPYRQFMVLCRAPGCRMALLRRPGDRTIGRAIGRSVQKLVAVGVEMAGYCALGGRPVVFSI